MKRNISESNLVNFLKVIIEVEGEISLLDFKRRVKESFNLTSEDLKKSTTRPNEAMYEQRCRNLKCHNSFPLDLIEYKNTIFSRK